MDAELADVDAAESRLTLPPEVARSLREVAKWEAGLWRECMGSTLEVPPDHLSDEEKRQWIAARLGAAIDDVSDEAVEKRIAKLPPHLRPDPAPEGVSALAHDDVSAEIARKRLGVFYATRRALTRRYAAMYRGHAVGKLNRSRLDALRAARPRERAPARRRRGSATSRGGSSGDRPRPPADLARRRRASRRGVRRERQRREHAGRCSRLRGRGDPRLSGARTRRR